MKTILRTFVENAIALWIAMSIVSTLDIKNGADGFIIATVALSLLNMIAKPILKIILLPLNFITFGLFSWATNVVVLYLLIRFVPFITLSPWKFPAFSYHGLSVASIKFNDWQTYIATSLIIAIIGNFLKAISR